MYSYSPDPYMFPEKQTGEVKGFRFQQVENILTDCMFLGYQSKISNPTRREIELSWAGIYSFDPFQLRILTSNFLDHLALTILVCETVVKDAIDVSLRCIQIGLEHAAPTPMPGLGEGENKSFTITTTVVFHFKKK